VKKKSFAVVASTVSATLCLAGAPQTQSPEARFRQAKFGMFIHWGLYAVPAGKWGDLTMDGYGEWIQHSGRIPMAEYAKFADGLTAEKYDAGQWVAAAKRAGIRYIVYTAKHHEGFAMYHSKVDPYNIVDATPFKRDPLKELATACRENGLLLGVYYSQCVDWHEAHGGNGPNDFKGEVRKWGNDWDFKKPATPEGFVEYLERKVKPQLRELLTDYGPIALIWFDTPVASLQRRQAEDLKALVKQLQPSCLIGSRIGCIPGDFQCLGDNQLPAHAVGSPSEACLTLNDTWGYIAHDHNWKSASQVVDILAGCASKGCNLLLNIGPMADGRLPPEAVSRLEEIGKWMDVNSTAVLDVGPVAHPVERSGQLLTARGQTLYVVASPDRSEIDLTGLRTEIRSASLATTKLSWEVIPDGPGFRIPLPPAPRDMPAVVTVELSGAPVFAGEMTEGLTGHVRLPVHRQMRGGDSLDLTVVVHRPGRFNVVLEAGGDSYAKWTGGQTAQVMSGTQSISATAEANGSQAIHDLASKHYPRYRCAIGEIDLVSGAQKVKLSCTRNGPDGRPKQWNELILERIDGARPRSPAH
jgi:alpha-L-fucosidase